MSGSNLNNTPPGRDRTTLTPSSVQSPSWNRLNTASTPTSSSPQISAAATIRPTTVEALLSTHDNAPLAALEQSVNERNLLSSQNAQLWKLIEKQRTGYNQILKELERVRNDRDSHKSKLLALGQQLGNDKKRDADGEKGIKQSHSTPLATNDNPAVNESSNSASSESFRLFSLISE